MLKSSGDFLIIFVSWCDEGLVVDVGENELGVVFEFKPVVQLYFVPAGVTVDLQNLGIGIGLCHVVLDGLRDDVGRDN